MFGILRDFLGKFYCVPCEAVTVKTLNSQHLALSCLCLEKPVLHFLAPLGFQDSSCPCGPFWVFWQYLQLAPPIATTHREVFQEIYDLVQIQAFLSQDPLYLASGNIIGVSCLFFFFYTLFTHPNIRTKVQPMDLTPHCTLNVQFSYWP